MPKEAITVTGIKKVHFGVTPMDGLLLVSNDAGHVDMFSIDGVRLRTLPMIPHQNTHFYSSRPANALPGGADMTCVTFDEKQQKAWIGCQAGLACCFDLMTWEYISSVDLSEQHEIAAVCEGQNYK